MTNSKDGQGHKDKSFNTSRKIAHVQYESSNIYYSQVMTNVNFKKKIGQTPKSSSKGEK